jgi:acetoacetyl-CoA synthetase
LNQSEDKPLWQPSQDRVEATNLAAFMRYVRRRWDIQATDYGELHTWSVANPEQFWQSVWSFCGVIGNAGDGPVLENGDQMPGARWFPGARLNFAENLLKRRDRGTAIVFRGEDRVKSSVTYAELHSEVSRLAQALRAAGVRRGDRVAGYLPNAPGAVIAALATASLGAIWSSCSPDFGVQGVLDRFGQIEPKALFAADGYFYNGKTIDCVARLSEITRNLPSVERTVVIPYTRRDPEIKDIPRAVDVHHFMAPYRPRNIEFERLPFDHPLYIMYSSGTTGGAQVHRARGGRHAPPAPEGAPAPRRSQAFRPALLFHDLRLDDVELARVGTGLARDTAALRRARHSWPRAGCSSTTRTTSA